MFRRFLVSLFRTVLSPIASSCSAGGLRFPGAIRATFQMRPPFESTQTTANGTVCNFECVLFRMIASTRQTKTAERELPPGSRCAPSLSGAPMFSSYSPLPFSISFSPFPPLSLSATSTDLQRQERRSARVPDEKAKKQYVHLSDAAFCSGWMQEHRGRKAGRSSFS